MPNYSAVEAANYQEPIEAQEKPSLLNSKRLAQQLGLVSLEGLRKAEDVEYNPFGDVENGLNRAIVGQPDAVLSIMTALNREKLRNPDRPIANLLFLGPTGVGKSETAKELARLLHDDDDDAFIKIDCSAYSHGHEITALTGAPPSYVGREQKPIFDPKIIEQDKSVILFDELEKGSGPLWDLMLQIMEDGEITLTGTGQKVSFRNSVIIMTSNLGANEMMGLLDTNTVGFASSDVNPAVTKQQIEKAAKSALKRQFRPEFINRFDDMIVFSQLADDQLGDVLDNYVEKANERYQDIGIDLTMTMELKRRIVESCEDRHQFNARPVLRKYEQLIESKLSTYVSSGSIPEGSRVYAFASDSPDTQPTDVEFYYQEDRGLQEYLAQMRSVPESEPDDITPLHSRALTGFTPVLTPTPGDGDDYII